MKAEVQNPVESVLDLAANGTAKVEFALYLVLEQ